MKAAPLLVAWHNETTPIYSVHFEPAGKGRLATGGGDNNIRLWQIDHVGEETKVTYLASLVRHSQAVNVVRWSPQGEMIASAGDDGNVLLWVPSDQHVSKSYGDDSQEDKESWHVKRMCRSPSGREIYDLAWSPDGNFFVAGSMDNVARIFDAQTGTIVRQIAEHNHYVQGVAWDPLNEYLATQSSDRSIHVYALKTTDGQFSLSEHGRMSRMDLPPRRRRTSNSPAPPEMGYRARLTSDASSNRGLSPAPSAPGTPASLPHPMNPPASAHSRRSSIGNASPSMRRSASPAPSMPLPAVMPSASPNPFVGLGVRNANIYGNDAVSSFFRRLTFAPDGSLLFTPAGQYKTSRSSASETSKAADEISNTVYIYTRGGLNKPPIAHLPGHKKPSIAVRCSPVYYNLRLPTTTKQIAIDTSSSSDLQPLPEAAHPSTTSAPTSAMEPPTSAANLSPSPSARNASPRNSDSEVPTPPPGPTPAFALPYRIVYAVATHDAVYVYDTQQTTPLCVVSNLHYAAFTDLTWSNDGTLLLMSSSDGFTSSLSFAPGELGTTYHGSLHTRISQPSTLNFTAASSTQSTPIPTPTHPGVAGIPTISKQPSSATTSHSPISIVRPASPTRSNSTSSVATQSSFAQTATASAATSASGPGIVISNPAPSYTKIPSVAIAPTGTNSHISPPLTSPTPPMTPLPGNGGTSSETRSSSASFVVPSSTSTGTGAGTSTTSVSDADRSQSSTTSKREADEVDADEGKDPKRRRVAPTLVENGVGPEG